MKEFITKPQGNTLFNKLLRILDDSPPDIELSNHLSSALQHIAKNNLESLFEHHKYALAQIEKMTPQALTILSDHMSWPPFQLASRNAVGGKITSAYLPEFTMAYCQKKGITDSSIQLRIKHSVNELINAQMIEARLNGGNIYCVITKVGKSLLPYINI